MPELPEVETLKIGLAKKLIGLTVKNIKVLNPKSFQGDTSRVIGSRVEDIDRRGKVLLVTLSNNLTLLIHLKMSGQLIYTQGAGSRPASPAQRGEVQGAEKFVGGHPTPDMLGEMPNKSTRVIFEFSDGSQLYFNDQRKFGWIKVRYRGQGAGGSVLDKLGPEPLTKDFTWQVLKSGLLKRKNTPVKVALLDQTVVAGVGNIYATEAVFAAKIDPRRKVKDLTDAEFRLLHKGVIKALKTGIKYGGSSRAHFVSEEGKKGLFLDYAKVYTREGQPCKVCGTILKKIKLGGRGTVYCPNCQK